MEICLINSNFCSEEDRKLGYMPTALLSLGAMLEKNGYAVKIVDLEELMRHKKLTIDRNFHNNAAKIIVNKNIDILGFNTRCDTYPSVLNIAKRCKELNPSCIIIFGGPQATLLDIETLQNFRFIDIIVRGEGELTIVELMDKLKNKERLQDVIGITYRRLDGKIVRNPDRKFVEDLDSLPYPAYHLMEEYHNNGNTFKNRWITIEGGRGCPYNCIFCSTGLVHRRIHRMKRPENIIKEMEFLKKRYGIKYFTFLHDHLLFDREKIIKMCEILIQRELDVYWACRSRPDRIAPELLEIMVKAGCRGIYLGIESGSQRIQKTIQKNIDVSIVPNLLEECEKYNMRIVTSFIIGFPDEKEEDINATLRLALRCSLFTNCVVQLHLLAPMPRTVLFERYKDKITFTGFFSNIVDKRMVNLKENFDLIKKYPFIFSVYYIIKPKYIPINLPYNIINVFSSLVNVYSLSCHIAMRELELNPMNLFKKLCKKIDDKEIYSKNFVISNHRIQKYFPRILNYIYKQKKINFKFLKYIIDFEKKKFNEYRKLVLLINKGGDVIERA